MDYDKDLKLTEELLNCNFNLKYEAIVKKQKPKGKIYNALMIQRYIKSDLPEEILKDDLKPGDESIRTHSTDKVGPNYE